MPLTIINRLYPQATNKGSLDLIENSIQIVGHDADYLLEVFPTQVFTCVSALTTTSINPAWS